MDWTFQQMFMDNLQNPGCIWNIFLIDTCHTDLMDSFVWHILTELFLINWEIIPNLCKIYSKILEEKNPIYFNYLRIFYKGWFSDYAFSVFIHNIVARALPRIGLLLTIFFNKVRPKNAVAHRMWDLEAAVLSGRLSKFSEWHKKLLHTRIYNINSFIEACTNLNIIFY